jgi:hypothetical protein
MKSPITSLVPVTVILLAILLPFQNCKSRGGSTTGNPFWVGVEMKMAPYGVDGPQKLSAMAQPKSGFEILACIYDISFYYFYEPLIYDSSRVTTASRVGPTQIQPQGTALGTFIFKDGEYNRIEIGLTQDFEWHPCPASMVVKNEFGTFESRSGFVLVYDGEFTIDNVNNVLELPSQELANAMAEVNAQDHGCDVEPTRSDCVACQQDPLGDSCKTIERLISERNLGRVYPR